MVDEVWLHIGTPKSGSSSLQKFLMAAGGQGTGAGVSYITPDGRDTANEFAIAFNRDRIRDLARIAAGLNARIAQDAARVGVISSEMLYGLAPDVLFRHMPNLRNRPLHVVVYLRRQDAYIEAAFIQKSKNGRFYGTLQQYIEKFDASGADYAAMLAPWEGVADGVTLHPRVYDKPMMDAGGIVADFCGLVGLPLSGTTEADINVSPGLNRVQLFQMIARHKLADPRKFQRHFAQHYPQRREDKQPIMTDEERRLFLDRFTAGNERLRARYFPDRDCLFEMPTGGTPSSGADAFSPAQLRELEQMFAALAALRQ